MSPRLIDLDGPTKRRGQVSPPVAPPPRPAARLDLLDPAPPLIADLPAILNPCIEESPATVMTRITLDWLLQGTPFDLLFEQSAEGEYAREFTLEHLVLVMLDVVCGFNPSTRSAFLGRQLQLIASLSAFYGKLNRLSPAITAAVVRHTAIRCRALIEGGGGLLPEPIPGYRARILDGNVLAGTDHRLTPTRTTWSACLPGKSLAIYEPASGLITDLILEENAHTQERNLLKEVPVSAGELWILDRNLCVRTFLFRIARAGGSFLARRHQTTLPYEPAGPRQSRGRCPTGKVHEQPILVDDPETPGAPHRLRLIILELDEPTREGETEIILVTNLPEDVSAIDCCAAYRGRWGIEGHFQVLTDLLNCEIPTLGYPRGTVRLRDVGRGRQRPGGAQGRPAGGARPGDGRRSVESCGGHRGGADLPGDDDGGPAAAVAGAERSPGAGGGGLAQRVGGSDVGGVDAPSATRAEEEETAAEQGGAKPSFGHQEATGRGQGDAAAESGVRRNPHGIKSLIITILHVGRGRV